jgi:dihydroneopterin aldolase
VDQIIIKDLEVFYRVGVPEKERVDAQRLLLTVEMDYDFARAAEGDNLDKTINYHAVVKKLSTFGRRRNWKLIETLAVEIAEMILREFRPARVTVAVKKFILPETRYVAVRVTRSLN